MKDTKSTIRLELLKAQQFELGIEIEVTHDIFKRTPEEKSKIE